jgi:hypothetical protein
MQAGADFKYEVHYLASLLLPMNQSNVLTSYHSLISSGNQMESDS